MTKLFTFLLLAASAVGQVAVSISPNPHPQFLDASGHILAGGFLFTYTGGTTTPASTYIDSTGTTPNPNPIPLDATGAPSNGSVQTGLYLANQTYKLCAYNSSMVQQWCADNVSGYLGLLNQANSWTLQQTFTQPIVDTATDNQFVTGAVSTQTTLDFPPPASNVTLHFPNTTDTMVGRATTDTLTNKSLTTPVIGGITNCNGPGTYENYNNVTGVIGSLASFNGAGVVITPAGATGGVTGVVCSISGGGAAVQESGRVTCAFDGVATSGHYVQASASVAGDCHDSGASYPTTGQVIGRVVNSGASVDLFGPEIQAPPAVYTAAGSIFGLWHVVAGSDVLGGGGTVTVNFAGSAIFATITPVCTVTESTAANAIWAQAAVNNLTVHGTAGDAFRYICIGY